jgi:hypothetical protein
MAFAKGLAPCIRPACGGYPHSIIAPWARCDGPSVAQRSSRLWRPASPYLLPLNPLHNDCVRPTERGVVRAQIDGVWIKNVLAFDFRRAGAARRLIASRVSPAQSCYVLVCDLSKLKAFKNRPNDSVQVTPSGGRVQVLRRGAFGRMPNEACWAKDGPSCRPSEQHRNEGSLAQPDPDVGRAYVKAIHGLHPAGRLKPSRFAPDESVSLVTFCASKEIRSAA